MWQSVHVQHDPTALDSDFIQQYRRALNTVSLPDNIATKNDQANDAHDDSQRRETLNQYAQDLQQIVIDPYHHGQTAGNRQNMNAWLSPSDAQTLMQRQLEAVSWQALVAILVTGADAVNFAHQLNHVLTAFPHPALQPCWRQAQALATHDTDKLFIKAPTMLQTTALTLEQVSAFDYLNTAKNALAISEAVASDDDPVMMLADFKTRRINRLAQISTALNQFTDATQQIPYAVHLSGHYLSQAFGELTMPDQNAPLTVILALGGTQAAVQPLVEVLSL